MRVGGRGGFSAGDWERALWEYANNDAEGMTGLGGWFGGRWQDQLWWLARVDRREIPPLRGAARSHERTRKKRPRRFGRNDRFLVGGWSGRQDQMKGRTLRFEGCGTRWREAVESGLKLEEEKAGSSPAWKRRRVRNDIWFVCWRRKKAEDGEDGAGELRNARDGAETNERKKRGRGRRDGRN